MINYPYERCITTWNEQWNKICLYLNDHHDPLPKFEDLIDDEQFINTINQILEYKDTFTVFSDSIPQYFRGVRENNPTKITESRFIPDWQYVDEKNPNRMNGSDRLYNYFTVSRGLCRGDELFYTSAHELRLNKDDDFYGCYFNIPDSFGKLKFIDLMTIEKIPKNDDRLARFLKRKFFSESLAELQEDTAAKWSIQLCFSIWENSIMFAPVDKQSKTELCEQYRPFHVMCDFFERNGFDGIIYRSTVYKKGACLALFDINKATCDFSTICKLDSSKYIKRKK